MKYVRLSQSFEPFLTISDCVKPRPLCSLCYKSYILCFSKATCKKSQFGREHPHNSYLVQ